LRRRTRRRQGDRIDRLEWLLDRIRNRTRTRLRADRRFGRRGRWSRLDRFASLEEKVTLALLFGGNLSAGTRHKQGREKGQPKNGG